MTRNACFLCALCLLGCTASSKNEVCDVDRDCLPGYRCSVSFPCSASRVCGATDYRCVAVPGDLGQGAPDLLQPLADLSGAPPDLNSPAPSERWEVFTLPVGVADLWGRSNGEIFALGSDATGRKFQWQAGAWDEVLPALGLPGRSLFVTKAGFFATPTGSFSCSGFAFTAQFDQLVIPSSQLAPCVGLIQNSVAVRGASGDPSIAYFLQSTSNAINLYSWTDSITPPATVTTFPGTVLTNSLWVVSDTLLFVGGSSANSASRVQAKKAYPLTNCGGSASPGGLWAAGMNSLWVVGGKTIKVSDPSTLDTCKPLTTPGNPTTLTRVFGHSANAVWIAGGPAYLAFGNSMALTQVTLPTEVQTALGSATFTAIWGVSEGDLWFGASNGVILHRTFQ